MKRGGKWKNKMPKMWGVSLSLLFFVSMGVNGKELIQNGDMEKKKSGQPKYWEAYNQGESKLLLEYGEEKPKKGKACLKLSSTEASNEGNANQSLTGVLESGKTYKIEGFSRADGDLDFVCKVALQVHNTAGESILWVELDDPGQRNGMKKWQKFTQEVKIPESDVSNIQILMYVKGKGIGWLDEVVIEEKK